MASKNINDLDSLTSISGGEIFPVSVGNGEGTKKVSMATVKSYCSSGIVSSGGGSIDLSSVSSDISPGEDSSYQLGSSGNAWSKAYADSIITENISPKNSGSALGIDGSVEVRGSFRVDQELETNILTSSTTVPGTIKVNGDSAVIKKDSDSGEIYLGSGITNSGLVVGSNKFRYKGNDVIIESTLDTLLENGEILSPDSILDNLSSTETNKALSANQGRVLDSKITVLDSKKASSSHTHGTITLTGDVSGSANFGNSGASIYVKVGEDFATVDYVNEVQSDLEDQLVSVLEVAEEAHNWGNHSDAGYLTKTVADSTYLINTDLADYIKNGADTATIKEITSQNSSSLSFIFGCSASSSSDYGKCAIRCWRSGSSPSWSLQDNGSGYPLFNKTLYVQDGSTAYKVITENELGSYATKTYVQEYVANLTTTTTTTTTSTTPSTYESSDATLKDIISDITLSPEQIAKAPSVRFTWKNGINDRVNAGTIAQYWKEILPEVVRGEEGNLSMGYGEASMVSVISLAKKVVEQEETITSLKSELNELKDLVNSLLKN